MVRVLHGRDPATHVNDMYAAANKIADALGGLNEGECRRAVLMALVATDKANLLVDPSTIGMVRVNPVFPPGGKE